ncbi:MAG: amidohydrolase family protein [Proteobacteria bacterium]|nr:amidohydrolase family protein [Pseudomonadota bacterium]
MNVSTGSGQREGPAPPRCLGPDPVPDRPAHPLPQGATDCHCHLFDPDPRYPMSATRGYTPPWATLADYMRMCERVGLERAVFVTASVYGFDNALTLAAIAARGQHRARGVVGVPADVADAELAALHAGGIRGVRLSTARRSYGGPERLAEVAARIAPYGWHLQLHLARVAEVVELAPALRALAVPVVFDHMAGVRGGEGVMAAGFVALLALLRDCDHVWVKLSGWYRRSDLPGRAHRDMQPLVAALAGARLDRLVFGTNWPHTSLFDPAAMPNDGALVETLQRWLPDADSARRVFTTNAARLYGFPGD